MRRIATILALFLVSACYDNTAYSGYGPVQASRYQPPDPYNPEIRNDMFSTTIDVKTEQAERGRAPSGTQIYGLYAKIDRRTGVALTYVQWSEVYTDRNWRFFTSASNDKSQPYVVSKVDGQVSSCSAGTCVYSETDNIVIPAADLRRGADEALRFKIYGKNGDERIITLPGKLITEFNAKVAEATKMRAARS